MVDRNCGSVIGENGFKIIQIIGVAVLPRLALALVIGNGLDPGIAIGQGVRCDSALEDFWTIRRLYSRS